MNLVVFRSIRKAVPAGGRIALHVMLCLGMFWWHAARYPLDVSLYYWWLAPLDAVSLVAATPLYAAAAPWGCLINALASGLETAALIYLGLLGSPGTPPAPYAPGMVELAGAMAAAARIPLGWMIAGAVRRAVPGRVRGCVP